MTEPTERRAYTRKPLRIAAKLLRQGLATANGVLQDFCLGGVLLEIDSTLPAGAQAMATIEPDESVHVHFSAHLDGAHHDFKIRARIAGVFNDAVACEFLDPDVQAIRALQAAAGKYQQVPTDVPQSPGTPAPTAQSDEAAELIERCKGMLVDYLRGQIDALFKTASEHLFVAARDAGNNVQQNQYFDVMKDVERLREPIESDFYATIVAQMDKLGSPMETMQEPSEDDQSGSGLSLVGTSEFGDWLAAKRIYSRAEPRLREELFLIGGRLGYLVSTAINEENNPVGLAALCHRFHDAVKTITTPKLARRTVFEAFDDTLVANLEGFYSELNGFLANAGVLPDLERPKPTPVTGDDSPSAKPDPEVRSDPAAAARAETSAPATTVAAPASGMEAQTTLAGVPAQAAPAPETMPGQAQPVSDTESFGDMTGDMAPHPSLLGGPPFDPAAVAPGHVYSSPMEVTHSAYSTAQTLLALSRQIMPQDPGRVAGPTYTSDQVQGAAALLQAQEATQPVPDAGRADLKTRLHGALQSSQEYADEKDIGPPEINAVEVIDQLVGAIVEDPLINDHVRPLVSKLEVPLLNAAMRDAEFFSAPSHPARQVINQLSRITGQPDTEGLDASVDRSVNAALDHIIANSTENDNAFSEAARQLDQIVTEQHSLREANIAQVVTDCEEQQALVKQRTGGTPVSQIDGREVSEELRQWLTRTKRLNIGDTVVLGQDTDKPRRAALAWVGENHATYVFVDDGGLKAATMTLQELAMQLRRGAADLVAESELTAMDRGLYAMLGQMHGELLHQASRDQDTGLVNRRELESQIETALGNAKRDGSTHVVILHDMDHFHTINETCGRKMGDRAIKETGRFLQKMMGGRGLLARLDEDKFGALLQNTSEQRGFDIAEKQRRSIEKSGVTWKGQRLQMSTSIGLVAVTETSENTRAVLTAATQAREQAKSAGGNRIEISKAVGSTFDFDRRKWIQQISNTFKAGRLELRCQKIAPIAPGDPSKPHYEILLGLRDDEGEAMLPGEFIEAAELYGRAIDVDRWVIENTFKWMVNNKHKLIALDGFSINLSAQSLSDESILSFVLHQFARSKLPPGKVLFEVTEHSAITSLSNAENFIRVLRKYGCRFLLDDFGTGHSSYSYLKYLPLDYIKIDGMFIKDIAENPSDQAMVKSINEIGHFMGKKTVAEYVESERALNTLRDIGVDYAQGFGIEKPFLLSEFG